MSTADADAPTLLRHLADRSPDRPWLFRPEGLDWRWTSRAEAAAEVERRARKLGEELAEAGLAAGAPVAYRSTPEPQCVILDLALQAAGYRPVPLAAEGQAGSPAAAGARALLSPAGSTPPGVAPGRRGPARGRTARGAADGAPERYETHLLQPATGAEPASLSLPFLPSPATLLAAARRLAASKPAPPSPGGSDPEGGAPDPRDPEGTAPAASGHQVTVAGHPFESPGQRLLVAWSLVTGGALVLEDQPGARLATAAWARPTLFLASGTEVATLRREAEEFDAGDLPGRFRRKLVRLLHRMGGGSEAPPSRPFRRLHTLVVDGQPGDDPEVDFFRRRGVRVVALDDLLPATAGQDPTPRPGGA